MKEMLLPEKVQQDMVSRLRRIEGQARGVQRMIEGGRDCSEIMNQLASIRAAAYGASVFLLKHYAKECSAGPSADHPADQPLDRLIELMLRSPR